MIDQHFGFDGPFLARLAHLALINRQPLPGPGAGPRRSPRHGASVEFADFRSYASGDDFRRVDWNAYARLGRLFLRLYTAEEMTTLTLLLDHSASMRFGDPSKALMAARLAAVLSYVALHSYDRVALAGWNRTLDRFIPPQSGKAAVPQIWRQIAAIMESVEGETDLAALREYGRRRRERGLAVVISDMLSESNWQAGLLGLMAAGQEVTLLQVLAPEDLNPELRGDWKLRDAETGREVEVTITPRVLRRYREELAAHTEALATFCRQRRIPFLQIPSDAPLVPAVMSGLHAAGVVT